MTTENQDAIIDKKDAMVSSYGTASRMDDKKQGLIARFLNWIAEGADKSMADRSSCPT